jgi:CubicO group peptidase (beta-lactamase class C family)
MRTLPTTLAALLLAATPVPAAADDAPAPDLTGLWRASRRFGPEVQGTLLMMRDGAGWRAEIAGFSVPVQARGNALSFDLPDGKGRFRGVRSGPNVIGHWIQARTVTSGNDYATPLTLRPDGHGHLRDELVPARDVFSFYMPVTRAADGGYATYLRNPERNQGRFIPVTSLRLHDRDVQLWGRRRGEAEDMMLAEGSWDPDSETISIPMRGATYDFSRDREETSPFYPRRRGGEPYHYRPPVALADGWPVATLEQEGLDRVAIEAFVQWLIDMRMETVSTSQIHSVLIARHGRLVLEEYFHGHDRETPHETRSAAKSLTATLIGAAMQSGIPIRLDTPVYATMYGGHPPAGLDPRKRAMTLEHLLTMSGGHYCDDGNAEAPGNESTMLDQNADRDFYHFILNLPMDRTPGERSIYCSIDPHLAGGVLARVAGEPLPEMFRRLVAEPLQMGRYYLPLSPTGDAYMGGGALLSSRDFLKVAQLMVNGGTWHGRRIVSREWARRAIAPLHDLAGIQYGYLWWSMEHPWRGRTIRAFFAGGNGGQTFMGIPELDLVIAFTGGNYADPALYIPQRVLVPRYILPAVR